MSDTARTRIKSGTLTLNVIGAKPYIILYASQITHGKSLVPPRYPNVQPNIAAEPAYITYFITIAKSE